MPNEILVMIVAHLSITDMSSLSLVCQKLREVSEDEKIWKYMYETTFGDPHQDITSWKTACYNVVVDLVKYFPAHPEEKKQSGSWFSKHFGPKQKTFEIETSPQIEQLLKLVWCTHNGHIQLVRKLLTESEHPNELVNMKLIHGSYTKPEWFTEALFTSLVRYRDSVLHVAVCQGYHKIAELLINAGAVVDHKAVDHETPLYFAARFGFIEVLKVLIAHQADVNSPNSTGGTPLMRAVREGQMETVKFLIENNADVNLKNRGLLSVYHVGCSQNMTEGRENYYEIIKFLLENCGGPFDEKDRLLKTPLHYAVANGEKDLSLLLLKHGACKDRLSSELILKIDEW
eukprot:CAMPEP_0174265168 /NCGR_PEP_ID=MMETSP0439-20130205/25466_1 /TAXON_ID=0 /ORGANISM="Stereomyxa ramosa, Strain Chinc5" /LENGTH=343 /DNA_ID=CAMNT_0015351477 /DNA_START=9 /DNA_END=1037 /DNA_ORIENTATION=-